MDGVAELKRRILEHIALHDLSARGISLAAGLSGATLSNILNSPTRGFDPATCQGLADALGWPEDELLVLAGHRSARPPADPLSDIWRGLWAGAWPAPVRDALWRITRETSVLTAPSARAAHWQAPGERAAVEAARAWLAARLADRHYLPETVAALAHRVDDVARQHPTDWAPRVDAGWRAMQGIGGAAPGTPRQAEDQYALIAWDRALAAYEARAC